MKKIKFISVLLITIIVLFFAGCGEDPGAADASYSNSNLPDNYSIRLPASVSGGSSKTATKSTGYVSYLDRKRALIANLISRLKSPRTTKTTRGEATSFAYNRLVDEIAFAKDFTKEFSIQFMAVDSAYNNILSYISANGNNTIPASNVSFTFTESMANSYLATMGDYFPSEDLSYVNQAIGLTGCFPEVIYETNVDSVYDYKITINGALMINPDDLIEPPINAGFATNNQIIIKWNNAKTKVYVLRIMQDTNMMSSELSVYDSENQTSTVRFNNSSLGMTDKLNIKLEGGQPKNGIILNVNYSFDDSTGLLQDIITGIADDEGGFLDEVFIDDNSTNYYRETFGSTGNLTGMETSLDGIIWSTNILFGALDPDYYTTGTNSTITGAINVSFSGVTTNNCFINIVPAGTASTDVMFNTIGTALITSATNASSSWIDFWGTESQATNVDLYIEQETEVGGMIMITNVPIEGGLHILL